MRTVVVVSLLLLGAQIALGQEQEGKLLNRLLKPDMTLANSAQDKAFHADGASIDKKASVSVFRSARGTSTRAFGDQREFASGEFAARHFRDGGAAANLSTRNQIDRLKVIFATTNAAVRDDVESSKVATTSEFAGQRPFLGRGKSQKALRAHDTPMTIEQVRELLNKNK